MVEAHEIDHHLPIPIANDQHPCSLSLCPPLFPPFPIAVVLDPIALPSSHGHHYPVLMTDKQAPLHMRSRFIVTGYRVGYSFSRCLRSIFELHNETVNIWTHLIGFMIFLYCLLTDIDMLRTNNAQYSDYVSFVLFLGCAMMTMIMRY
jgi:hypothetical protein